MPDEDMHADDEMAYDPDQKVEDKRKLRAQYRRLLGEQDEHRTDLTNLTVHQLLENQKLADRYFQQVRAPQEATLDSKVMLQNAEMGAAMARAMKHDQDAFDIDNFITELISFMGGTIDGSVEDGDADGDLDWNLLGRKCYPFSRRAPALDFMLGPLSIEVKQRKKVVRSKLAKNKEDEVHPQELRADEIQRSENETSKMVKVVHRYLRKAPHDGVPLLEFVTNPHSYAQSIENLFYVSFLVRDGLVTVWADDERGGLLMLVPSSNIEQEETDEIQKKQQVFIMTPQTWREAIELFNIQEPKYILHRERAQEYDEELKGDEFLA